MRRAIAAHGLPAPVVNMPFVLDDGTPIEIDLAWPDWTLALEVDHWFWHGGTRARHDKRRDRVLGGMGWMSIRVTDEDVEDELDRTVEELGAVLERRGWSRPRTAA